MQSRPPCHRGTLGRQHPEKPCTQPRDINLSRVVMRCRPSPLLCKLPPSTVRQPIYRHISTLYSFGGGLLDVLHNPKGSNHQHVHLPGPRRAGRKGWAATTPGSQHVHEGTAMLCFFCCPLPPLPDRFPHLVQKVSSVSCTVTPSPLTCTFSPSTCSTGAAFHLEGSEPSGAPPTAVPTSKTA